MVEHSKESIMIFKTLLGLLFTLTIATSEVLTCNTYTPLEDIVLVSELNCTELASTEKYDNTFVINYLKSAESFVRKAKLDYKQYSNGYGTKAKYRGEVITRVEAERRFKIHVDKVVTKVLNFVPVGTPKGTIDALVSLSYNAGFGWMRSGLGRAVLAGDVHLVRKKFVRYKKVTIVKNKRKIKVTLKGLAKRRQIEVKWII